MAERIKPLIIDPEDRNLPDVAPPSDAPPIEDGPAQSSAEIALRKVQRRSRSSMFGRLVWGAFGGLIVMAAALGLEAFITDLFTRHPWLGWLGTGFVSIIVFAFLAVALRELAALSRLSCLERTRSQAADAIAGDSQALSAVFADLDRIYGGRTGPRDALAKVAIAAEDNPDATARLALVEQLVLTDLDRQAEAAVARAARDVAATTAFIPLALVDVLAVLAINLRMIRKVATIYSGRAGFLGSLRLLRAVATHLVATGAVAATDELLGPMVGGGILGKLSRRFGEAAVNAALTARVGVSALEVCRPLPFTERPKPKARNLVLSALKDWRPDRSPS